MEHLVMSSVDLNRLAELLAEKILGATPSRQEPDTSTESKIVSEEELCKILNITRPTCRKLRQRKQIPFFSIGSSVRYDLGKVVAALETKKPAGTGLKKSLVTHDKDKEKK